MQNEIQVFSNDQFGSVRTIERDGAPWFVGRDVAEVLGYKNPQDAIRYHVADEDRGVSEIRTPGGRQKMPVINESGLYALVLGSKLPTAKEFKRWITSEVVPAIRVHGAYFTDRKLAQLLSDPTQAHLLVMEFAHAALVNEKLKIELAEARPKALYYDQFVDPQECTNIRITAKELGVPEKQFTAYLQRHRYLYRAPSGKLMPYAYYYNRGFFIIRDFHKRNSPEVGQYTLFTAIGKEHFLYKISEILAEGK